MVASDGFGEEVGWVVLAFCVGDRDLSAFRQFLHKEEQPLDMLHLGCLCELRLVRRG